jgi:hypothetical protein
MSNWLLIDTADEKAKDGHDVLVGFAPGGRQMVARWQSDLRTWVACDDRPVVPTHFQELGDAPVAAPPALPVVTSLAPASVTLGDPDFTLHVLGTGFAPDAVILWNDAPEPTVVVSPTEVTTGVNMATAQVAMPIPVAVRNGNGAASAPQTFTFLDPVARSKGAPTKSSDGPTTKRKDA